MLNSQTTIKHRDIAGEGLQYMHVYMYCTVLQTYTSVDAHEIARLNEARNNRKQIDNRCNIVISACGLLTD